MQVLVLTLIALFQRLLLLPLYQCKCQTIKIPKSMQFFPQATTPGDEFMCGAFSIKEAHVQPLTAKENDVMDISIETTVC